MKRFNDLDGSGSRGLLVSVLVLCKSPDFLEDIDNEKFSVQMQVQKNSNQSIVATHSAVPRDFMRLLILNNSCEGNRCGGRWTLKDLPYDKCVRKWFDNSTRNNSTRELLETRVTTI